MADRRELERRLRVVEQQLKHFCKFTQGYKELEQERFRLVKLLQGQQGSPGQQGFVP